MLRSSGGIRLAELCTKDPFDQFLYLFVSLLACTRAWT
jgi:hypothetical protein